MYAKASRYDYIKDKSLIPTGYQLPPRHSNNDMSTFINRQERIIIIAYRGTNISKNFRQTLKDLIADASIFLRLESKNRYFKNAANHFEKIRRLFKNFKKILTGHSLGGFTAP